jgi:hypothetical protein
MLLLSPILRARLNGKLLLEVGCSATERAGSKKRGSNRQIARENYSAQSATAIFSSLIRLNYSEFYRVLTELPTTFEILQKKTHWVVDKSLHRKVAVAGRLELTTSRWCPLPIIDVTLPSFRIAARCRILFIQPPLQIVARGWRCFESSH